MKLDRRHLFVSLLFLAASVVYNVWALTRPRAARHDGSLGPFTQSATAPQAAAVDAASAPPPPPVDLTVAPVWMRNPFAPQAVPAAPSPTLEVEAVAPTVDPVVGAILYSDTARRYAIVDGRIAGIGERVGGAVIADIERDAIVLRLDSGERRRLTLQTQSTPGGRAR